MECFCLWGFWTLPGALIWWYPSSSLSVLWPVHLDADGRLLLNDRLTGRQLHLRGALWQDRTKAHSGACWPHMCPWQPCWSFCPQQVGLRSSQVVSFKQPIWQAKGSRPYKKVTKLWTLSVPPLGNYPKNLYGKKCVLGTNPPRTHTVTQTGKYTETCTACDTHLYIHSNTQTVIHYRTLLQTP